MSSLDQGYIKTSHNVNQPYTKGYLHDTHSMDGWRIDIISCLKHFLCLLFLSTVEFPGSSISIGLAGDLLLYVFWWLLTVRTTCPLAALYKPGLWGPDRTVSRISASILPPSKRYESAALRLEWWQKGSLWAGPFTSVKLVIRLEERTLSYTLLEIRA